MTSIIGALPYTRTNGTTADANAVQANFAYIVSQVNANVQAAIAAAVLAAVPVGIVAKWSGSITSIPAPWQLCDGTNGTEDLRDKFIVGAGNTYAVGATGGAAVSTITVGGTTLSLAQIPGHSHGVTDPTHSHGVTDPTHSHGVNDPQHQHTETLVTSAAGGASFPQIGNGAFAAYSNTALGSTGITLNAAATGISTVAAATGITTQNAGGGGSSGNAGAAAQSGGAGGYIDAIISAPSATYSYSIGAGGTAGTGTYAGGAGAAGIIIVEEHYWA